MVNTPHTSHLTEWYYTGLALSSSSRNSVGFFWQRRILSFLEQMNVFPVFTLAVTIQQDTTRLGSVEKDIIVSFIFSQKSSITYYYLHVWRYLHRFRQEIYQTLLLHCPPLMSHLNILVLIPEVLSDELHSLGGLVRLRGEEDVRHVAVPPLPDRRVVFE